MTLFVVACHAPSHTSRTHLTGGHISHTSRIQLIGSLTGHRLEQS